MKQPCVYVMASKKHGTLYVGVTSDLRKRVYEHQNDTIGGFTARYGVHEASSSHRSAVGRKALTLRVSRKRAAERLNRGSSASRRQKEKWNQRGNLSKICVDFLSNTDNLPNDINAPGEVFADGIYHKLNPRKTESGETRATRRKTTPSWFGR